MPDDALPFVLFETATHGLTVVAANPAARRLGIAAGLALNDARARVPALAVAPVDRAADAAGLIALGRYLVRYSPHISCDGEDGLCLDITGCAHLFGGEQAMVEKIRARLQSASIFSRLGLADTPLAARALALTAAAQGISIIPHGELATGLARLPVAALGFSPATVVTLHRFGLARIGQLYDIDRRALTRRFSEKSVGDAVLQGLDRALGRADDPRLPLFPPPRAMARLVCPEPLATSEGIETGLEYLAKALSAQLIDQGLGARALVFLAFRTDGVVVPLRRRLARGQQDPGHIFRIFREKIDAIDPGHGIDLLVLEAKSVEEFRPQTGALPVGTAGSVTADLSSICQLADRLSARLGEKVVRVNLYTESFIPERKSKKIVFNGQLPPWPDSIRDATPDLLRLLRRPEPVEVIAGVPDGPPARFVWRRVRHDVVRAAGPRRVAPEWWRSRAETARTRDYYAVEDQDGRRYWMFRHGLFDEALPPKWYVQGLMS